MTFKTCQITQCFKQSRLALRDAAVAAIIVMSMSALTGYVVYHSASEGLKREVQGNLASLASAASNLIDADGHQRITEPEQKGSQLYEELRAPLFKLLKANDNIAFIYTAIQKEGKIYFILDSKIIKPGEEDDTSNVMEEYTDATDTMRKAFREQKIMVEEEAYTDEWGTFLSGYAPIYNSNQEFVGIIGADLRLEDYLASLSHVHQALAIAMGIAFVASLVVAVGVFVSKNSALKAEARNKEQQAQMVAMEQARQRDAELQKQQAEKERREAMQEMAETFEFSVKGMVSQVASSAANMQAHAANVTGIAADTKERSSVVANVANDVAYTSSQVSAAAEELSASIREISAQTQKSSQVAGTAFQKAESAKQAIHSLAEKSQNVSHIIDVITAIAGQINLLALNATIESARAGEAGKGFAVVASEVKNLASQVSKATDEITTQINTMQDATKVSVDSVMDILTIIDQVSHSTEAVAAAVEEQSAVTNEIAHNIARTAAGTQQISENISSVQNGADQTGDTARQVLEAAEALGSQSALLKQKVEEFIRDVRA